MTISNDESPSTSVIRRERISFPPSSLFQLLLLHDEERLHELVHRPCSRLEIRESVLLLIVLCHIALRELSMNSDDRINRRLKILESDASLFIIGFPPRGNLFFLSLLLPSLLLRVSRYRVGWKKFCFQR